MDKSLSYNEALYRMEIRDKLKSLGISVIDRVKKNYKILGSIIIGVGVVTWFIPFTTIPLISLGCVLMGITIKQLKWNLKYKISKYKKNWGCLR